MSTAALTALEMCEMNGWKVLFTTLIALAVLPAPALCQSLRNYTIVGTGQTKCYDNFGEIACPKRGQPFYGQDAQFSTLHPAYRDNGDGTISDLRTGLMWVKGRGDKVTWDKAVAGAADCRVAGYSDWRMPTIKELYSLINFSGGFHPDGPSRPYIDTSYFGFKYGDTSIGERPIDCQDWSATQYAGEFLPLAFGVNFADGRIKGYPKEFGLRGGRPGGFGMGQGRLEARPAGPGRQLVVRPEPPRGAWPPGPWDRHGMRPGGPATRPHGPGEMPGRPGMMPGGPPRSWQGRPEGRPENKKYVRYVRGNPNYGKNDFHDNGDGTISDRSTGLMWSQTDSGSGMTWEAALAWVQKKNQENYLGYNDWRLSNAKELQSIVDYSRGSRRPGQPLRGPAINHVFRISQLSDGEYPFFWTSTTHLDGPIDTLGRNAVYVAFGRALGWMRRPPHSRNLQLVDVHGAGAQRSDPKAGNPSDFPHGRGPQGDVIRIYNYVRCVRGG